MQVTITFVADSREDLIDLISYYTEEKNLNILTSYVKTYPSLVLGKKGDYKLKVKARAKIINNTTVFEIVQYALDYVTDIFDLPENEELEVPYKVLTFNTI